MIPTLGVLSSAQYLAVKAHASSIAHAAHPESVHPDKFEGLERLLEERHKTILERFNRLEKKLEGR